MDPRDAYRSRTSRVWAHANDAVAAAIPAFSSIVDLVPRRKHAGAQVLRGFHQNRTKTNVGVAIGDCAWSTTRGSSAIQLQVFRKARSQLTGKGAIFAAAISLHLLRSRQR